MSDPQSTAREHPVDRASDAKRLPLAARITAGAVLVLVGAHMFLTAVYNVPSTEVKYGALPGAVADRYIRPYLVQDYKIFAPDPADTDRQLWVRAWVEGADGEREYTEWVNATRVELAETYRRTLRKQLSIVGAERLMAAHSRLSEGQKEIAAANHLDGEALYGLQDALLAADDADPVVVREFIRADNFVTSYATQVAHALWGERGEIVAVQARAVYDPVIRWVDRHDLGAERPPSRYTELGWVPPMEWPLQDREAFGRTFRAWADRAGVMDAEGTP